jgi:hypothetical protein
MHFRKKTKTKKREPSQWLVVTNISLLVAILVVGSLYVFQVNHAAGKGYEMRDLEREVATLREKTRKLEIEMVNYQSMQYLQDKAEELELISVEGVEYLDVQEGVMVRR